MSQAAVKPRLARCLVRLYPRVWRERYEAEFLALLEAREDVGWMDALDIMRAVAREWGRSLIRELTAPPDGDLTSLKRQARLHGWALLAAAVLIDLAAFGTASILESWGWRSPAYGGVFYVVQTAVAVRWYVFTLLARKNRRALIAPPEMVAWTAAIFVSTVAGHLDIASSSNPAGTWWFSALSSPIFRVWINLAILSLAARTVHLRNQRIVELTDRRRTLDVPSNPLGLR